MCSIIMRRRWVDDGDDCDHDCDDDVSVVGGEVDVRGVVVVVVAVVEDDCEADLDVMCCTTGGGGGT